MDLDPARRAALLTPSLASDARERGAPTVELYSARACFLIAFFGGGLAALVMGWINARRLGRLGKDAWVFVVLGIAFIALQASFADAINRASAQSFQWLGLPLEQRDARHISRAAGLLMWGALYARHRPFYRAMAIADVAPKKPWVVGIAIVLLGGLANLGLLVALLWVTR
jgi:hypothetical protein